jgi:hypothetical protein
MAKTVIVKLTDDIDGGDADETVYFSLDGKTYEIDVNESNAAKVRDAFAPFIAKGRVSAVSARVRAPRPSGSSSEKTLFSQLSSDEKGRFAPGPTWKRPAGSVMPGLKAGWLPVGLSARASLQTQRAVGIAKSQHVNEQKGANDA